MTPEFERLIPALVVMAIGLMGIGYALYVGYSRPPVPTYPCAFQDETGKPHPARCRFIGDLGGRFVGYVTPEPE